MRGWRDLKDLFLAAQHERSEPGLEVGDWRPLPGETVGDTWVRERREARERNALAAWNGERA